MYEGVPWNILGRIQKFNFSKFPFNSDSGDDVDIFSAAGLGRIRFLMLPIRVPLIG